MLPPLGCGEGRRVAAASSLLRQDPRAALPGVVLRSIPAAPNGEPAFTSTDFDDPTTLAMAIAQAGADVLQAAQPAVWLRGQLSSEVQATLSEWAAQQPVPPLPVALHDELLQLLRALEHGWQPRQDLPDLLVPHPGVSRRLEGFAGAHDPGS